MTSWKRAALIDRLSALGEVARRHPADRRARTVLNDTFRKETLAQWLAVWQTAAWLVGVLEKLVTLA